MTTRAKPSKTTTPVRRSQNRNRNRRRERVLAVVALALIAIVWVFGAIRAEADLLPVIQRTLPEADHLRRQENGIYSAWADAAEKTLIGYIAIGTANGYGGPLELAVAVDPEGRIIRVNVISHKETASWYERVMERDVLENLAGKSYADRFQVGADVDSVTSATYTTRALAEAALRGSQAAARLLGLPVAEQPAPTVQFGLPEITVLGLFAVGLVAHRQNFRYKKQARWGTMLIGLAVLGFVFNLPLTVTYFSKLILGYWPQWQTNLYWYFLLGGVLFVVTVDSKNPYCDWFCPFGAVQECLGALGGAKLYAMGRWREPLKWVQRGLALAAVLLGVFFRNPSLGSYEIFGSLFSQVGSTIQFVVLALVLLAALFIKRPWCNYLCPMDPIMDFVHTVRQWSKELWQRIRPSAKAG